MLKITDDQIQSGEFQLLSQKEKVMGKAFTTQETRDLFEKLKEANIVLPRTQAGADKMMTKACQIAGTVKRLNQHLWRKLFISQAINLGISEMIWKILAFKTVPSTDATYFLNGSELRTYWEKIVNAIPLQKTNGNGKISNLQQAIDLVMKVQRKQIEKELGLMGYQIPDSGLGLIVKKSDEEILREYLES